MMGKKYDKGKVRMGLCFTQFSNALLGVAKVLTYGAWKYPSPETGDRSWLQVDRGIERYGDAFDRHMYYVRRDMDKGVRNPWTEDTVDPETGQMHIDHAITNLLFLRTLMYGSDIHLDIIKPEVQNVSADKQSSTTSEASTQSTRKEEGVSFAGLN